MRAWAYRRVPTVLSRSVRRDAYLATVRSLSDQPDLRSLEVLAPRLTAVSGTSLLAQIQDAWVRVNRVGEVRVITGETEACLTGAAGLASKGVDVRIARTLESDNLSYHVFTGNAGTSTIINHREDDRDRPVRLNGIAPSRVYRGHFAALWAASVPVESVLADRAVRSIGHIGNVTRNDVVRRVQDLKSIY